MVVFNDPVPVENPALQAVLMALEMRVAIGALIEKWRWLGHDLGFGIGIAHGFATLGTIGFEGRFDYAAIAGADFDAPQALLRPDVGLPIGRFEYRARPPRLVLHRFGLTVGEALLVRSALHETASFKINKCPALGLPIRTAMSLAE